MATKIWILPFYLCVLHCGHYVTAYYHQHNLPEIIYQPDDYLFVDYGYHTSLSCIARADESPIVYWNRNGVRFSQQDELYQSTIQIRNVTEKAVFTCVAWNSHGTVTSKTTVDVLRKGSTDQYQRSFHGPTTDKSSKKLVRRLLSELMKKITSRNAAPQSADAPPAM